MNVSRIGINKIMQMDSFVEIFNWKLFFYIELAVYDRFALGDYIAKKMNEWMDSPNRVDVCSRMTIHQLTFHLIDPNPLPFSATKRRERKIQF